MSACLPHNCQRGPAACMLARRPRPWLRRSVQLLMAATAAPAPGLITPANANSQSAGRARMPGSCADEMSRASHRHRRVKQPDTARRQACMCVQLSDATCRGTRWTLARWPVAPGPVGTCT